MMMGTITTGARTNSRERVDHRADVFSTAVVLYELLSGRRAFDADSFAATLYKILEEVPAPLQQIDGTLPPSSFASSSAGSPSRAMNAINS